MWVGVTQSSGFLFLCVHSGPFRDPRLEERGLAKGRTNTHLAVLTASAASRLPPKPSTSVLDGILQGKIGKIEDIFLDLVFKYVASRNHNHNTEV